MPKAKVVKGSAKKASVGRVKKASVKKAAAPRRAASVRPRKQTPQALSEPAVQPPLPPPPIEDAQSQVTASKFASVESPVPRVRPTLPASYGESRLLLLPRDPQTLFAAWDLAPSTTEALRARLGRRGFAVSTLTLRLTRAGGGASVVHVGKKTRSRYLKVEGGPSFVAEVGFTTPAGRFELVARSAPCFVPMGPFARAEAMEAGRRAVGYREAAALARRGGLSPNPGSNPGQGAARARTNPSTAGAAASAAAASRTLGGASDLYRR